MSADEQPFTSSPTSATSTSSFVYPVKSLLTRKIQPEQTSIDSGVASSRSEEHINGSSENQPLNAMERIAGGDWADSSAPVVSLVPSSLCDGSKAPMVGSGCANTGAIPNPSNRRRKSTDSPRNLPTPNYRHYPAEENIDPYIPRTFATATPVVEQNRSPSQPILIMETLSSGLNQSADIIHEVFTDSQMSLDLVGSQSLSKGDPSTIEELPLTQGMLDCTPFNPSQYGLVHLPPLPNHTTPSGTNSSRCSSRSAEDKASHTSSLSSGLSTYYSTKTNMTQSSSGKNPVKSGELLELTLAPGWRPQTLPTSQTDDSTSSLSIPISSADSGSDSNTTSVLSSAGGTDTIDKKFHLDTSPSNSKPASTNSVASSESQLYTTFRFRHEENEDGHHTIVGREGTLYMCEDEPIRTPGAVQGYGVLIAVEETEDALVVRQVSENSGELLGLPHNYLFSLECFTDTLPESQAALVWDSIQFLEDQEDEEEDKPPHIFLLNGFGAPGISSPSMPGEEGSSADSNDSRRSWTCWCAVHRPQVTSSTPLIIMEFELEKDIFNPLYPPTDSSPQSGLTSPSGFSTATSDSGRSQSIDTSNLHAPVSVDDRQSPSHNSDVCEIEGNEDEWDPCAEDILESTTSYSKPIPALERLRRMTHSKSRTVENRPRRQGRHGHTAAAKNVVVGMVDIFAILSQINEQLGAAPDLNKFLKVVAGVIKDLTQFHRVMVYQFDEAWNGIVVAELIDWGRTQTLYRGLHFPAADIPAQARSLYTTNKVRLLYDREQATARLVVRSRDDLREPLDMTHCYLRAMSPIHIKYLANMGVRASMSISIVAFGALWGLIACHSFGSSGMRVSFPVRLMLRLLSQSISRNIERLSYAQRLHTRKLINTLSSVNHPTGYIVSDADDLLALFDADYGILVVGDGAKILGPNQHGQEVLVVAEYLRLKQFATIQASQAVTNDFPDLQLSTGLEVIAGLLYVPLSSGGRDFIAFLRKGQLRAVRWAGKPKRDNGATSNLEPRKSFKTWSEMVAGRCRAWTDEQLETAGVLALVYGKFIEVWRQKQDAIHATTLTNLLLSNASHEVRTPLNHIINYLEMALNGQLDSETRDNLNRSHAASKSLLFTINDLLDLTRMESSNETSLQEVFNLVNATKEATYLYQKEAERRGLTFTVDVSDCPTNVVGDAKKIKTVIQNLTANALKFTTRGTILVSCKTYREPEGLRSSDQTAVEILVADTGCGIPAEKLECLFREFEQVESVQPNSNAGTGLGLGLAVVARIVSQLGGQLRVESNVQEGSRFSFLISLPLAGDGDSDTTSLSSRSSIRSSRRRSLSSGLDSKGSEIESLVEAIQSDHMRVHSNNALHNQQHAMTRSSEALHEPRSPPSAPAKLDAVDPPAPPRAIKIDETQLDILIPKPTDLPASVSTAKLMRLGHPHDHKSSRLPEQLRILVVEDNDINRTILSKRLRNDGHAVVDATNGREGVDKVEADHEFDLILMDLQMPILNGFEAAEGIRRLEKVTESEPSHPPRVSHQLNGRIPIFAVSASLAERQRNELANHGMDGWILKPINFKRLRVILKGLTDPSQRRNDLYRPGCSWEAGGWLGEPSQTNYKTASSTRA